VLFAAGALTRPAFADSPCPAKCEKSCPAHAKQGPQVCVEVRFVTAPEMLYQAAAAAVDMAGRLKDGAPGALFLSEGQLFKFLEAAQGDRRTSVTQAPKLMVADGERGEIKFSVPVEIGAGMRWVCEGKRAGCCQGDKDCPCGFRVSVRPKVSEDRQCVRLALH